MVFEALRASMQRDWFRGYRSMDPLSTLFFLLLVATFFGNQIFGYICDRFKRKKHVSLLARVASTADPSLHRLQRVTGSCLRPLGTLFNSLSLSGEPRMS